MPVQLASLLVAICTSPTTNWIAPVTMAPHQTTDQAPAGGQQGADRHRYPGDQEEAADHDVAKPRTKVSPT